MPRTVRTTFLAAAFILPVRPFALEVEVVADFFAFVTGIRALTDVLTRVFRAAGFRGDFNVAFGDFAGDFFGALLDVPLARARIFFLVSGDGRLSWEVLTSDPGVALLVFDFRPAPRTAALTLEATLTFGSLIFFLVVVPRLLAEVVAVFLAAAFPRAVVALVMAFLTPALMDFEVMSLRFLA